MRSWVVIPLLGVTAAEIALCTQHSTWSAAVVGCVAVALGAAIRSFIGRSLAAALSGVAGALLGVIGLVGLPSLEVQRGRFAIGGAAALFAIYQLTRSRADRASPAPAIAASLLASALDPSYVPLWVVVAVQWAARSQGATRRWMYGVAVVGVVATCGAVALATLWHDGATWRAWSGLHGEASGVGDVFERIGDLLGPIAACCSVAGLVLCILLNKSGGLAISAVAAMTVIAAWSSNDIPPAAPMVAGVCSGVAIGRFAASLHHPAGQAFIGAVAGFVLVVGSAWSLVAAM